MSRRLYFLEQHCLYVQQFGFCNSQSTNQALLINKIITQKLLHKNYYTKQITQNLDFIFKRE